MKLVRNKSKAPTKILQIGAGVFTRAYLDYAVQLLNESGEYTGGIEIATSSPNKPSTLNDQDGLYTMIQADQSGVETKIIDIINKQFSIPDEFEYFLETARNRDIQVIFSNTTEIGIVYEEEEEYSKNVHSFPARMTVWLETRFNTLKENNATDEMVFFLPCELITDNGSTLKKYILQHATKWNISSEFVEWIKSNVHAYDTLVDRMVVGYPPKSYLDSLSEPLEDEYAVFSEKFFFLAARGKTELLDKVLPLSKLPLDIVYTDNLEYYFDRKVYFLNGSHTAILGISILLGYETVQDSLKDKDIMDYLKTYQQTALDILKDDSRPFVDSVLMRFTNPYLSHKWSAISLNAMSKILVRNMPLADKTTTELKVMLLPFVALWMVYYKGMKLNEDPAYNEAKDILGLPIEELAKKVCTKESYVETFVEIANELLNEPRNYIKTV